MSNSTDKEFLLKYNVLRDYLVEAMEYHDRRQNTAVAIAYQNAATRLAEVFGPNPSCPACVNPKRKDHTCRTTLEVSVHTRRPQRMVCVDGIVDSKGIRYLGNATEQPDGSWQCLADVNGALCRVEISIKFQE